MKDVAGLNDNIAVLKRAVEQGGLPQGVSDLAHECIARAHRKLRVAVVGGDAAATTNVTNFFLGSALLPTEIGEDVPARIAFGDAGAVRSKSEDGSVRTHDLDELEEVFADDPLSVSISAPLSPLKRFTLMRIGMEEEAFATGTSTLLSSSDVVFWCSDAFGEDEMAYWAEVPAQVADHGYLVVAKGAHVSEAHRRLFHQVVEVDVARAEELRAAPEFDKSAFEDCGGAALLHAIRNEITTAERALEDAVSVALLRLGDRVSELAPLDVLPVGEARLAEDASGDLENPWIGTDFAVSRVRGTVKPRRVEPVSLSLTPEEGGEDGEEALREENAPVNMADFVSLVDPAQDPGAPLEDLGAGLVDEEEQPKDDTLNAHEDLRAFLSASLSSAREQDASPGRPADPALDASVSGMIDRLLEDAGDMLTDRETPSHFVLDWVEDKLKSARELIETHQRESSGAAGSATDPIDDALEAVSVLRFEDEADHVREDALRMALQVGRELQTRLAG